MPQSSPNPAPNPKTESTPSVAARIKSLIRNTFLASPEFPRLYADVVISSAPNSNEAKILARNYKKNVESKPGANLDRTNLIGPNRANMPNPKNCTHIKVTGPSSEGAKDCSPRRKPWVSPGKGNEPRRGERNPAARNPGRRTA